MVVSSPTDALCCEVAQLEVRDGGRVYAFEMELDPSGSSLQARVNLSHIAPGLRRLVVKRGFQGLCPEGALYPNDRSKQVPEGWSCVYDLDQGEYFLTTQGCLYVHGRDYEGDAFNVRIDGSAVIEGAGASTLPLEVDNTKAEAFTGEDGGEYYAMRSSQRGVVVFGEEIPAGRTLILPAVLEDGSKGFQVYFLPDPSEKMLVLWDTSLTARLKIRAVDHYFIPVNWSFSPYVDGAVHARMPYRVIRRTSWLGGLLAFEKDKGILDPLSLDPYLGRGPWVRGWLLLSSFNPSGWEIDAASLEVSSDENQGLRVLKKDPYNREAYRGGKIDRDSMLFKIIQGGGLN
jgi:hypothetical protein